MADSVIQDTQTSELQRLVQWFEASEDAGRDARATSEKCRDYYDGNQWTAEEAAVLKKRKQPLVVINRIKPKINTLKGMESQSRTNPKALPRNASHDEEAANAAQDAIRFVLDSNDSDTMFSECFDNLCIEGTEGVEIQVVPKGEDFDIVLRQIHWDRQFFDPHSRERSFSDARYLGEVVWMDREDAIALYPDAEAAIAGTIDTWGGKHDTTYQDKPFLRWADWHRQRVCLLSICYRVGQDWMHAIFVRGGFVQEPQPVPFLDEDGLPEPMYIFQSAYVDRDGNRYGPVKDWLSVQDEINKRRSKALHLINMRQVKARKGSVDSIAKLREQVAQPDGVIEENIPDGVAILPNGDMAAAQFQLLAEAKAEIDAVGVNAALSGAESRSMSGRALEARANAGTAEVRPILDAHAHFKNRVYRAIWNRIRQYWTAEKWVRVTDEEKNLKFVGLNRPVTMAEVMQKRLQDSGEQVDPAQMQALQADPMMRQIVGRANVPAELDVDIILDEVPDFAALQSEQFATLAGLARAGMQIPPDAIIKASSLRDKEGILKSMRGETEDGQSPQLMQAQQLLQQAAEEVQKLQSELEAAKTDNDIKRIELEQKREELEQKKAETNVKRLEVIAGMPPDAAVHMQRLAGFRDTGLLPEEEEMNAQVLSILAQMEAQRQEDSMRRQQESAAILMALQEIANQVSRPKSFAFQYDSRGDVVAASERLQ